MDICQHLICPCNNKLYKSTATLKAHQKTQGHIFYQQTNEQKDILVKINRLEIENSNLRHLNILLIERIKKIEF